MRLYRDSKTLLVPCVQAPRAVAIGVFDGLHIGHQAIFRQLLAAASPRHLRSLVFSFEPMPMEFFSPQSPPPRLTRFRERFEQLGSFGIQELYCPRFGTVRGLSAQDFIEELLVGALHAREIFVGDDFRFGEHRRGSLAELQTAGRHYGFDVTVVPPVDWQGRRVSSTAIRHALRAGDLATARGMLGRDYSMSGRVVRGLRLGRTLGFPTANVHLKRRQTPIDGIFAARVTGLAGRPLDGVASVGTRPTVGGGQPLLEVHIFDFDADIYGRYITVHFIARLREERNYPDLHAMQAQMHKDVLDARAALAA
jgi:riboflavin kinase/FMN adenylyltransferase